MARTLACVALLLLSILPASPTAQAIDRELRIEQMARRTWTAQNGAPSEIDAIAQTQDGLLWLGTANGLYRFDGISFRRFVATPPAKLRTEVISALLSARDGALWIGYGNRGVARLIPTGELQQYDDPENLGGSVYVRRFLEDRDGRLWAASNRGLLRLDQGRWVRIAEDWGHPARGVFAAAMDSAGTLWSASPIGVFRLVHGERRFQPAGLQVAIGVRLIPAASGVYLVGGGSGLRRVDEPATPALTAPVSAAGGTALLDRDGMLWLDIGQDLVRLPLDPVPPSAGAEPDRLNGLDARAIFEDREGNIWLASKDALHQFRSSALVPMTALSGGIVPAEDGDIWLAAHGDGAFRVSGRDGSLTDQKVAEKELTHIFRDAGANVWLGGLSPKQVWRIGADGVVDNLPMPEALNSPFVNAIAQDAAGGIWVNRTGGDAWMHRLTEGQWLARGGVDALPGNMSRCMLGDPEGRMWFGYDDGRLARLDGDQLKFFAAEQGLEVGSIMRLHRYRDRMLVFGEAGMAAQQGDRFVTLAAADGLGLRGVTGAAESADGALWLNGSDGIVRIQAAALDQALAAGTPLPLRRFDSFDGLEGRAFQFAPAPAAAAASDGHIWFSTTSKLYRVDPARLQGNPLAPPVRIDALIAEGGQRHAARDGLRLPQGTRRVEFDYTAGSLTVPERVRFRYRLSGVDTGWQEAGARRSAFYSNLSPGDYRFQVIAANDDGLWNEQGQTLAFRIEPAFHQTRVFMLLCAVAGGALLWALYLLRMRQVAGRIGLQMRARQNERERIARELHDTLLQGFQGLIWRIDALSQRLRPQDSVREDLRAALDEAEGLLVEGRDRVAVLRESASGAPLERQLQQLAERLRGTRPLVVEVRVEGSPRRLQPMPQDEIQRIVREAVLNILRHAEASMIRIELYYRDTDFELHVVDDGRGIADEALAGKSGHWGLQGMRERARNINAQLTIRNALPGTVLSLIAPASVYDRLG